MVEKLFFSVDGLDKVWAYLQHLKDHHQCPALKATYYKVPTSHLVVKFCVSEFLLQPQLPRMFWLLLKLGAELSQYVHNCSLVFVRLLVCQCGWPIL